VFVSDNDFIETIYLMLWGKKQRFQSIERYSNHNVVTLGRCLKQNKLYLA